MGWWRETFSDHNEQASFKRQLSAVIAVSCILAVFTGKEVGAIAALAGMVGVILTATSLEKRN